MNEQVMWTRCVFQGPPPEGYSDWNQWIGAATKMGATIRASEPEDWADIDIVRSLHRAACRELALAQGRIVALERLRPVWAQGWTSDGVAAQASSAALSQLWGMLGVSNQTEAVEALRRLLGE